MYSAYFKRTFDAVVASLLLVVLSPVIAILYALVRQILGAPVFFVQERTGKNGKSFHMVKFRTMKSSVDASGKPLPDEVRMTKFGNFLRKASLDELPELINVIRGQMSLVGPRPLLPQYLKFYTPEQNRRHDVLPGVTGWSQINGRNSLSWSAKFELDVWYVDNQSFLLDLIILLKTVFRVFNPAGVSQDGHATMPLFDQKSSSQIAVIGAGGHAKVVIETLRHSQEFVSAIFDDNPALWGQTFFAVPVTGPISKLTELPGHKAIVAIGNNDTRRELAEKLNCQWVTAIHPLSIISDSVEIGTGTLVAAGAVIQPDTKIGEHVIINTSASVDHDCRIDSFAHICPNASLAGGVHIGKCSLLGTGSTCIPGVRIGANCQIGAASVVTRDIPENSIAIGIPARALKSNILPQKQGKAAEQTDYKAA
ncbi:NeuD/PglB/VioB family sugar acetyltransferase [Rubinisphaera italica]|uniref:Putative sugar transferase EpsL n=1 Tax=Rubinisphaera italica TaxID=2527969 RepID=A0A5C5XBT7_9PLAN|nr:NeuD/PglB/VioB family sugar acetyltransferase [Rubinisphaera italica]TWT59615.1 putative sugar transferase EpsL [Rubinisphaera italica]